MVAWVACPLGLAAGVGAAWGPVGLALLAGQALVGSLLLEVINYVEVRHMVSAFRGVGFKISLHLPFCKGLYILHRMASAAAVARCMRMNVKQKRFVTFLGELLLRLSSFGLNTKK